MAFCQARYEDALEQYQQSCEWKNRFPKALGIGYYLVQARLGLARTYRKLERIPEAVQQFQSASQLFSRKEFFSFHWIWEGTDAQIYCQIAAYHAIAGERGEVLVALRKAVDCGWRDAPYLEKDERLADLSNDPEFLSLVHRLKQEKMLK